MFSLPETSVGVNRYCSSRYSIEQYDIGGILRRCFCKMEIPRMAQSTTKRRNLLTRCLAAAALVSVYCVGLIGASTIMLTAGSTAAQAQRGRGGGGRGGGRGFGRGGGFRGGGFGRGGGFARGRGYGFYGGPRFVAPGCYFSRRWGRVVCPY
jgi:hypothetical protein